MNYKLITVNNRMALITDDVLPIIKEPFFNLKPGDSITQVGDGTNTGTYRTDQFKHPVTYVGAAFLTLPEPELLYLFDTHTEIKSMFSISKVYLIYGSTGLEVFTEAIYSRKNHKTYMRFYKPVFAKAIL